MKVRFYCRWFSKVVTGDPSDIIRASTLVDAPDGVIQQYNNYLLSALDTNYRRSEHCDEVLRQIDRLERGEIQTFTWEGDGFFYDITRDTVTFEHAVFGECPEWPVWRCSLTQYKVALEGWKRFLAMPKSIDSELIVDLP
jgi:hypothetical protein